ncbi:hypothetical protein HHK36_029925 [Tetracentron sinense]|uniref:Uncharacterized protein n=1 Tax=Tetracentron sinense TaxID=13715 RepID=A0A834YFN0_TETSI|nr:hypothetical protein HHK36_029925 [Tetracentron sinense]
MAMQTASPATTPAPSAQLVGSAFVEQYYHILHQSPELVHRFYQDSSILSRPDSNGVMESVTTMQAINDKILSLDYKDYKAEIETADAQNSYKEGVLVLVTGCLTGKDNVRRKFTQSFFLAPQDKGYFVLNDVFRYVEENEPLEINVVSVISNDGNAPTAPLTPDPEPTYVPDGPVPDPATSLVEKDLNNGEEVSANDEESVIIEVVVESLDHSSQNEIHPVAEPASSTVQEDAPTVQEDAPTVQEDAPKKSYASIVKVVKRNMAPTPVYVPTNRVKLAPANTEQRSLVPTAPGPKPEALAPSGNSAPEKSNAHEEVEGHSIYIRSLPMNATVAQLEEEFKKFGPIKPDGIQVRSNKLQVFCFGFVEFESLSSMHSAIEASPIAIGGRQAFIEEKRTTSRGKYKLFEAENIWMSNAAATRARNGNAVGSGGGRGRFPSGRGGFRNDNFMGRGNFGGGRGYGRNDFGNRGDFSGRARGSTGRSGSGYQRVDQNGNSRVDQNGNSRVGSEAGVNQSPAST